MRINCPECGAHIPVENVSLESGRASCPSCEWQDALKVFLPDEVAKRELPPAPADTKILSERPQAGEVTFYIPSRKSPFIVFFAAVWNVGLAFMTVVMVVGTWEGEGDLPLVFVPLIVAVFWAAGLGFLVAALFSIYGRTLVHVDGSQLVMKRELFGLGRVRRFDLSPETSAKLVGAYEQNDVTVYACAVSTKSKEVKFGSFLSDEEKSWLVAVINDVLSEAFAGQRPAPGAPPRDTKIVVNHMGPDHVEFDIPSRPHTKLVVFAVVWCLVVCPLVTLMTRHAGGLERWLFPAFFWLFGAGILFATVWSLFGRTHLAIEGSRLTVRKTLFGIPLIREYTLGRNSTAHLVAYSEERVRTSEGCPIGITTRGGEAGFGEFLSQSEKLWLIGAINDVLEGKLLGSPVCPNCGRQLTGALVNERLGVAKCPDCDELFQTSQLLRGEPEEALPAERAEEPPDTKVQVEHLDSELRLTIPPITSTWLGKLGLVVALAFAAAWFLGLARFAGDAPKWRSRLPALFALPFWVAGVVFVVGATTFLGSRLELTFAEGVVVRTRRLWLFRSRKELSLPSGARVTFPQPTEQRLPTGPVQLVQSQAPLQLRYDGGELKFGYHLSVEERRWLCQRINEFLEAQALAEA